MGCGARFVGQPFQADPNRRASVNLHDMVRLESLTYEPSAVELVGRKATGGGVLPPLFLLTVFFPYLGRSNFRALRA